MKNLTVKEIYNKIANKVAIRDIAGNPSIKAIVEQYLYENGEELTLDQYFEYRKLELLEEIKVLLEKGENI